MVKSFQSDVSFFWWTMIRRFLIENDLDFVRQKQFDECVADNGFMLKFDFWLESKNMCIEYDGEYHFYPIGYFGGKKKFHDVCRRDSIKNQFCQRSNIQLLRIPFYDRDNIENILEEKLL